MIKEYINHFSPSGQLLLLQFIEDHQELLKNPLIESFLKEEENLNLLVLYLQDPSDQNKQILDITFREYYTGVKMINYLSKTLHWEAVNFDKMQRKNNVRFPLIVDGKVNDEEPVLAEKIALEDKDVEHQIIESSKLPLVEKLENINLKNAFLLLTNRQKEVLQCVYGENLSLTETAVRLSITQQGASKIHKLAIERLRKEMGKSDERMEGTN